MKQYDSFAITTLCFLPLLLFCIITYFLREEIFLAWRNFAFVWIPLSIIITAITPDASGSFQVIDKEFVAIIFSGLFVLISLILVAYKFFSLKKTRLGN